MPGATPAAPRRAMDRGKESEAGKPIRVLWVFAWLVVGGEETEVRLLAANLDTNRFRIDVLPCMRVDGMPDQSHQQLRALNVRVDTSAYSLDFEDTVEYIAERLPQYDVIVASQAVPDVYPALERARARWGWAPPLIEHGGSVDEARRGPKHLTARYVGVCRSIRNAAAAEMRDRPQHAIEIPSMVDLAEFDPAQRTGVRAELGVRDEQLLVGWVGRLDRKKRVQDFIEAAGEVAGTRPDARFVIVGGPDAFMPEYAGELQTLGRTLGLADRLTFLGDRPDVPRLLSGMDVFAWLSRGEGMPHVISEAGAARLPVIATRDNGSEQQITDGETGVFVPHNDPPAVAAAIRRLLDDIPLRSQLGAALQRKVRREYSAAAVCPQWERLLREMISETRR